MPIINWNEGACAAIPYFDQHHKQHHRHLVQLLNDAYDDFRTGRTLPPSFIDELITHAAHHFSYEESLMVQYSYPGLSDHKAEHSFFSSRVLELQKSYQHQVDFTVELLWFLCSWVTHHIRETDAQFWKWKV